MLLLDDILASPFKFVLWVMEQVHEAAEQEMREEAERIPLQLAELYRMLEAGQISEGEFDRRERALLDRLDQLGPEKATGGG